MSPYPHHPEQPARPDELGDLLAAGIEREVAAPVDTGRLLDSARTGATRLRRRRRAYGAVTAAVLVAGVPFGMAQLSDLVSSSQNSAPLAELGTSTARASKPPTPIDLSAESYPGELKDLRANGLPIPSVEIPLPALLTPSDAGLADRLPRAGVPTRLRSGVHSTVDQACLKQPGGLQWDLGSQKREYDGPNVGAAVTWQLKVVSRALTVRGATSQLTWLRSNLDTCTGAVDGSRWTLESAVDAGDGAVLATVDDGDAVIAIGAVRVGAAVSGFWLTVPQTAGSRAARAQIATSSGQALLEAGAERLRSTGLSGAAVTALGDALQNRPATATGVRTAGSPAPSTT